MSMVLVHHAGRLLAVQEAALGWGGHSDRSRSRNRELDAVREGRDILARGGDMDAALEPARALCAERTEYLKGIVAEHGVSHDIAEWTPIPSAGIGRWEVRRGELRRVAGSGSTWPDGRDEDVPAVARAVEEAVMPGVEARLKEVEE